MSQQPKSKDMQGSAMSAAMAFADSSIPDFKKKAGVAYIPFGEKNDYPGYILNLYNKSAKHAAIINGKVVYIFGNGFKATTPNGDAFLKKANPKQSWDEIGKIICQDIENYGGTYLQVIPKAGGGYNVFHVSFEKIRSNEDNSVFYYRKVWENSFSPEEKRFKAFRPGIKEASIFFFKEYHGKKSPYPLPTWVAACNWIEADIEVSKATLTKSKKGFSASKFINFFNGEPTQEKKSEIKNAFEATLTGSEGDSIMIGFNNDPAKRPTVDDLGASDLTKEDFTAVDNLITNNIFSGHNITHPLLFGIQQEGKLGSATELRVAFEIFKNTYVTSKQKQLEKLVGYFAGIAGVQDEFKLIDVEPVGVQIPDSLLEKVLPVPYILEKLGIDTTGYQSQDVNSVLTNLTGRQQQNIMRIVRQFSQGKINQAQATLMLKNGYGFTDADVNLYLGVDMQFSEEDDALLFEEYGSEREGFEFIKSEVYTGDDDEVSFAFKTMDQLTQEEANVAKLIQENPKISDEEIAIKTGLQVVVVTGLVKRLAEQGVLEIVTKGSAIIRKIGESNIKKTLPQMQVMYSYEKRPDVDGPTLLPTSRPFCKKMVGLSQTKMFSRQDIQKISEVLGYSVFKRAGGFWNNNGTIEWQCRHAWIRHVVIKKK